MRQLYMKNNTIIFDMDGVLVDSEIHWKQIQSEFLKGMIPTWSEQDQIQLIGLSAHDVYKRLVSVYGIKITVQEYFNYYKSITHEIYGVRSKLIPDVVEVLESLSNYNLGLASSSPHPWIDIVLDRFDLRKYFKSIVSADDVAGVGKPDPGIYRHALAELGAENAVAVEDSEKGVQSAISAGLKCLAFKNGFNDHQDLSSASLIIHSLKEINKNTLAKIW